MSENEKPLFSSYGDLYLLLEVEPRILHEAIADCSKDQLEQIMEIVEDQFNDIRAGRSNLENVSQFLTVWAIAFQQWEGRVSEEHGEDYNFNLSFRDLVNPQQHDATVEEAKAKLFQQ